MVNMKDVAKIIREIEKDSTHSVNVSKIDEEHRDFIKIVNKVINIANKHDIDREEIAIVLYEMTQHALNHFKTEEEYMKKFECTEYQLHKKEHKGFLMKTVDFCSRTMKGDYDITNDLLEYLQSWLVNHIQGTDKKFSVCFK